MNKHSIKAKANIFLRSFLIFINGEFKKNQWKHRIFQVFLTFILFISTFCGMYLQYYQKQLNQKVEEYKSSQLVIEMDEKISGTMLREMEGLPTIKSVKRVLPLMSDNQYLICPYLESDFFTRGIKQSLHNDSHTGFYINYETYRDTKDQAIEIEVEGKSFTIQPDYPIG